VGKGATPVWQSRRRLLQAGGAVLLSTLLYPLLLVVHRPLPAGFTYPEQSFSRWALYVCLLLTFWSLAGLFADWRQARNRARCIAGTSIPPSASLASEEGVREVMGVVRAAAARYGDGLLAQRIEKAIARFRNSHSAAAAAEELAAAGDVAMAELEARHAPVRVFLYAIPILGFAGTVMGIRQTLEHAALSPSSTPQQLDAIRVAITRITSSMASSFDAALLALVLTLVVMVALTWAMEKEKNLLLAIEDFCRVHLLPLMQPVKAQPADALVAREETLIGVLTDLRCALEGVTRNGAETEAGSSLKPGDQLELGKQYLEQSRAMTLDLAQRFGELRELLSARPENLATVPAVPRQVPRGAHVALSRDPSDAAFATAAHVKELSAPLEALRDSIIEMGFFLQRFAARLRSQTEEPVVVTVKTMPGPSSTTSNNEFPAD